MNLAIPVGAALFAVAAWFTFEGARLLASRLFASTSRPEHLLRVLLVACLLTVWSVAGLGSAGWLGASALASVAAVVFFAALQLRAAERTGARSRSAMPGLPRWPVIATALVVGLDLCAFLPAPPVDWDAMTYHLYLPARWLQEGEVFHVPTVFSDNAAAFAPQNGALFFAWQMAVSGRDTLINVSQLLCLAFLGLALYRCYRLLAVDRQAAALAALTLPWLAPLRRWTYSANVDVFMLAFAFGSLYWQLLYLERRQRSTIALAGLAGGLAMGTKALGLPLVALQTLPMLLFALWRRRFADLALFVACAVAGGGGWYLANAWRYGNPLFPVQLSLGPLTLPGAYGAEALRAGEFHLQGLGAVAASLGAQWGLTTCLLTVLGLVALGLRARRDLSRRRSRRRYAAALLLLLAIAWAAFFALAVPHNNQARFALPTLLASLVGWGLVLQQARRRSPATASAVWFAGIAAAALAAAPWADWLGSLATLERAGIAASRWLLVALVCGGGVLGARTLYPRLGRRLPTLGAWLLVWAALTVATFHSDASRAAYFAQADYRGWSEGYLAFNDPAAAPARIAYTGANVPYALAGAGWRHRVVYVNTQGAAEDGFYDFWNRERRVYPYHKPGIYRGEDDVDLWLERLESEAIDTVVIFRLHRAEHRYIRSTPAGFPLEQAWVRQHPERFEPVFIGPAAEIWRTEIRP